MKRTNLNALMFMYFGFNRDEAQSNEVERQLSIKSSNINKN